MELSNDDGELWFHYSQEIDFNFDDLLLMIKKRKTITNLQMLRLRTVKKQTGTIMVRKSTNIVIKMAKKMEFQDFGTLVVS